MTFMTDLYAIRKLTYKEASIQEKYARVVARVEASDHEEKWRIAFDIFKETRLKYLVSEAYVRQSIVDVYAKNDVTFRYKADTVINLDSKFGSFVDVIDIAQDVFVADFDKLKAIFDNRGTELSEFLEDARKASSFEELVKTRADRHNS